MDIFEKCNQRYIQDEVRDLGIYPYFHALESRQDTEVIMEGSAASCSAPTTISA